MLSKRPRSSGGQRRFNRTARNNSVSSKQNGVDLDIHPNRERRGDKPMPEVPPKKNRVVLEILILGVSTFASIVRTCPVDGFSRLMYTYTCSYGAVNFNRSMVSVFVTTSYNFWLGQAFRTFVYEIDIPKVWDSFFFFVHNRISVLRVNPHCS